MTEELKKVGEMLQLKRREKNLSLKEVENGTSIRQAYLEAIETGVIAERLAGIYAQGFLKQYALFLGFDLEQLIRNYPAAFRMREEKHEFPYGIGTLEPRGSQSGGVKWFPHLVWAGVAAVVILLAWVFARFLGVL